MIGTLTICLLSLVAIEVPMLRDADGVAHSVLATGDDRFVVVAFLGVECPLANLYAERLAELAGEYQSQRVRFIAIDSNRQDHLAEVREFAAKHHLPFPMVKDIGTSTARQLGARRTPEVIVLDRTNAVRYRGRIDDQYLVGVHRDAPTTHDLRRALDELVEGREVSVPETAATGCLITDDDTSTSPTRVTYSEHIAPLLERRCTSCHRPERSGPMSLTDYDDVVGWSAMIDEVVEQGRMPPWHADRRFGKFANDASLDPTEKAMLREWVGDGCPRGEKVAPSISQAVDDDWSIGQPEVILSIPRKFVVPATGIVEYQYFTVDPGFTEDQWVSAIEIRPSNRRVVHHCNVFLCPPGSTDVSMSGELGSVCLAAMAAGTQGIVYPSGMAKRIPAGWQVRFVVHYTTVGSEQVDRTQLGLKLANPDEVTREVATRLLVDFDLNIPPGDANYRVERTATIERDLLLLAMFPHMHLRGKSFTYEARYPDGSQETLLSVPRWDFNWQHRYELAEPKVLLAGTQLRCVAVYDNSAANSSNPNASVWVHTGERSDDEMFNAYYDVAPLESGHPSRPTHWSQVAALGASLLLVVVAVKAFRQ